jgi:hypothetical protein
MYLLLGRNLRTRTCPNRRTCATLQARKLIVAALVDVDGKRSPACRARADLGARAPVRASPVIVGHRHQNVSRRLVRSPVSLSARTFLDGLDACIGFECLHGKWMLKVPSIERSRFIVVSKFLPTLRRKEQSFGVTA